MKKTSFFMILSYLGFGQISGQEAGVTDAFQRVEIDAHPPQDPWIKITGDINKDSRPDVIVGGRRGPLVWYANPGWEKRVISEGGYDAVQGTAGDIDGDGDLDIVLGGVFWYENPGPATVGTSGPWPTHQIDDYRAHDTRVADLDGDGRLDVIARDQSDFNANAGNRILLYYQRPANRWTKTEIACPHGEGLQPADLDSDGDPDLVIGGRWYENPGKDIESEWKEHFISGQWDYASTRVAVADFNGDQRPDVAFSPSELKGGSYKIAWYAAPKDPGNPGNWRENLIDQPVETVVHSLNAADMNGDGRPDIVAASMHQGAPPHEVCVYLNRRSGRKWQKLVIATTGSHGTSLADLDGDGKMDVLGANWSGPYQPVEWWRNGLPGKKKR